MLTEKFEGLGKWFSLDRRGGPQGRAERIIGRGIRAAGESKRGVEGGCTRRYEGEQ